MTCFTRSVVLCFLFRKKNFTSKNHVFLPLRSNISQTKNKSPNFYMMNATKFGTFWLFSCRKNVGTWWAGFLNHSGRGWWPSTMTFDLGTWKKVVDWLVPSLPHFKILLYSLPVLKLWPIYKNVVFQRA